MAKRKNSDHQNTAELLQKLQAAVLSNSRKQEKKPDAPDRDELEFQQKIAGMLNRITSGNESAIAGEKPKSPKKHTSARSDKTPGHPPIPAVTPEPDMQTDHPETDCPEQQQTEPRKKRISGRTAHLEKTSERGSRKGKKPSDSPLKQKEETLVPAEITESTPQISDPVKSEAGPEIEIPEESRSSAPVVIQALTEQTEPPQDICKQKVPQDCPTPGSSSVGTDFRNRIPDAMRNLTSDFPKSPKKSQTETTSPSQPSCKPERPEASSMESITQPSPSSVTTEPLFDQTSEHNFSPENEVCASNPVPSDQSIQHETEVSARQSGSTVLSVRQNAPDHPIPMQKRFPPPEERKNSGMSAPPAVNCRPKISDTDRGVQNCIPRKYDSGISSNVPQKPNPSSAHSIKPHVIAAEIPKTYQKPVPPVSEQKEFMQKNSKRPDKKTSSPEKKELTGQPSGVRRIQPASDSEVKTDCRTPNKTDKQESDSIVIQPPVKDTASAPIVIKPRQNTRAPEPVRAEKPESAPKITQIPVREPVSAKNSELQTPQVSQNRKQPTEPKKNTGAHQASEPGKPSGDNRSTAPSPASVKRGLGGISLPHFHGNSAGSKNSSGQGSTPLKKRTGTPPRTPIAPLPEDEGLDEALDEIVSDTTPHVEEVPVEEPEVLSAPIGTRRTAFAKRREMKARQAEQISDAITLIGQKTGMTADDIALIFELGYENELGRLVGYETLKKLKSEHIRKGRSAGRKQYPTAFGYRGAEYTGKQARETILAGYARDRKHLTVSLVLTALIALIMFPLELPAIFGTLLDPYRTAYPLLFPILSIVLLMAVSGMFCRRLDAGLRNFFRFTPDPYSLNAILVPLTLIYCVIALCVGGAQVPAAPAAVCSLLLCGICDAFRLSDEMRTFRLATADGAKTVLEPAEPRKKKLRHGDKIVKIINDDLDQNIYRIRKSEQITGFFRRCNDFSSASRPFMFLICSMLVLSLLGALIGAIVTNSLSGALSAFITILMFSTPTSALLIFFYPLCCANRLLSKRNCALIGNGSVEEYKEPKTVIFNDSDMFTTQKCTQISVRDGEDFRQDMILAGILFRKIGGTLDSLGQAAPMNTKDDPPVAFVRMTENGTEAVVDSHHHLLAGNSAFMSKNGVRVPRESTDRAARRPGNVSLMYVAVDGALKLSYEIEYKVSASFERMAKILADSDTLTAIQTYDPNLNEAFLQTGRGEKAGYVRVIKPGRYEQDTIQEITDSGIIVRGRKTDIVHPLTAASTVSNLQKTGYRTVFIAMLIGAILGGAVSLNADLFLPGMPLFFPLLYRLFCAAVSFIASHITFRDGTTNRPK